MQIAQGHIIGQRTNDDAVSRQRKAIESQAHAELRNSAYAPVRRVSCEYHEGVLTLRGRVPSYFLKQVAQTAILHGLEGMVLVNNRVEVVTQRT
jgi:hypothetical protein